MKKEIEWAKNQIDLRDTGTTDMEDPQFYVNLGSKMALDFLNQPEETEVKKINQEEYEHINWLLKQVKKEIKRKDDNLGLLDWSSAEADRLSGQIDALKYIEMLINEIGKPSYFKNKHRESELN